jgi:hypothetical protein
MLGDSREWTGSRHSSFVVSYVPIYQFDAHLTTSGRFLVHERAENDHPLFDEQITKGKASMKLSEGESSGGSREVAR